MSWMFAGWDISAGPGKGSKFNQPIGRWNVDKVKKMSNMFNLATSFNQPLDGWNMKKEMDLSGMFMDASSFNQPLQN